MAGAKRKNWTASRARRELDAWRQSGLTMAEHCRRQGLSRKKLQWWKRRLADFPDATEETPRWIEATIVGAQAPSAVIAIVLEGTERVEVWRPEDVDATWLATFIAEVQRQQ